MITKNLTISYPLGGGTAQRSVVLTGTGSQEIDESFAENTTDQQMTLAVTVSKLSLLVIYADQDLTIETNADDHTGGDQLDVKAGKPILWYVGCGYDCPFTVNVTTSYITVDAVGDDGANLQIIVLEDATP